MEIYEFSYMPQGTAICLGDFDGAHKGHRQVFSKAAETGKWGALLFTHNSKGEKEILTLPEKLEVLKQLGAGYAVAADFETELKEKSPGEFIVFLKELAVNKVVTGYDYRFGKGAAGDVTLLKALCGKYGIEAVAVPAETAYGEPIKSTKIRELIKNGDIKTANTLLGSRYKISGMVERGFGNGTDMGIPTANIEVAPDKLLPKDGVYKGMAGSKRAVINVGKNPTFDAKKRTVEVHLIGETDDLYGKMMTVEFMDWIRDEIKFKTREELILQIKKDIESVKE